MNIASLTLWSLLGLGLGSAVATLIRLAHNKWEKRKQPCQSQFSGLGPEYQCTLGNHTGRHTDQYNNTWA